MYTERFNVSGMTCAACSAHVEKAAKSVSGVESAAVSLLTNSMTVTSKEPIKINEICAAVEKAGYNAKPASQKAEKKSDEDEEFKSMKKRFIYSLVILIPLMYVSMGHMMWGWYIPKSLSENAIAIGLYEMLLTIIVMIINQHFFKKGFKSLMHKAPNMDTLVALGSGSAFVYSMAVLFSMTASKMPHFLLHDMYFESAAMIPTLIGLGKTLEAYSRGKATSAIKGLMELEPETAHVVRGGKEITIPSDEVVIGDIFIVYPGESIPVDGTVEEGESSVNEAALTGESMPQDKSKGSFVSGATINQNGYLTCRAARVGSDTTLSRIIELVENVAATKAPIAKIADKVSGIFVPAVILIAVVTAVIWAVAGQSTSFILARAISVLVISCPCALGLATPVAIMAGSAKASKYGILFKTAASLENAGKTDIIVLDKTGTVTEGNPCVTDVIVNEGVNENELLKAAAALECKSSHPLSRAIMSYTEGKLQFEAADEFSQKSGFGVFGKINGENAFGGNAAMISENNLLTSKMKKIGEELSEKGKTPLYFAVGERLLGIIAVSDIPRKESRKAIGELKEMGLPVVLLTGDNKRTANAVGEAVGADITISDVLPEDKEKAVRRFSSYGRVAMVGDGINDAPALTAADCAIAIGAGADVAIDAADVVLINSNLSHVVWAIRLSRAVIRNIHENLFWAFFYNCIGIPIAAGALISPMGLKLNPMIGAAAMSLSSFCVVSNALRLSFADPEKNKYNKKRHNISVQKIKEYINEGDRELITKKLIVDKMMCDNCAMHVKNALEELDGVETVSVNLKEKSTVITMTKEVSEAALSEAVRNAGYEPVKFI